MEIIVKDDWIYLSRDFPTELRKVLKGSIWVLLVMKVHPEYNDLLIANELDMMIENTVYDIVKLRDLGYVEYNKPFHCNTRIRRNILKSVRDEIKEKYKQCAICGATSELEIDHIIPVSKGGKNNIENLQILCKACNRKKHDK